MRRSSLQESERAAGLQGFRALYQPFGRCGALLFWLEIERVLWKSLKGVKNYETQAFDQLIGCGLHDDHHAAPVGSHGNLRQIFPLLEKMKFDYQGLRYKKLSSSTVSVVGPVEVQTERVIPETVVNNGTTYTVTEIGDRAFDCRLVDSTPYKDYVGKPNFVSIKIPKTITRIGAYAFRLCGDLTTNSGLVNVIFDSESQLKLIDHDAFANCCAIREFELPVR